MGIFPRSANPSAEVIGPAVNKILATFVSDPRITYMDIGTKFLQPDGKISEDIMTGFLHPTAKGFVIWGDAIQPVVEHYLSVK